MKPSSSSGGVGEIRGGKRRKREEGSSGGLSGKYTKRR